MMVNPARWLRSLALLGILGCDTEDPTRVVVDNDYPPVADGGNPSTEMTVFRVWWVSTLLPEPVAPGSEGQAQRAVPNSDFAYALLAPGWDPSSGSGPDQLLAAKSVAPLGAARGDTLHVHVSDVAFAGNCAAGKPLSQEDADFITQRIFPGEFAGISYDAARCGASIAADAGTDATADGGSADDGARGDAAGTSDGNRE
jgi:hypothetical protein